MIDGVKYVVPKIQIGAGSASVYNIRLLPMALPYSKGFVQINNFIDCLIKNRNFQFNISDIIKYIKEYLLPYSSHIKITETNALGDLTLEA
jgi:hypothetical protein